MGDLSSARPALTEKSNPSPTEALIERDREDHDRSQYQSFDLGAVDAPRDDDPGPFDDNLGQEAVPVPCRESIPVRPKDCILPRQPP